MTATYRTIALVVLLHLPIAANGAPTSKPSLGVPCSDSGEGWNKAEIFVWKEVCAGKIADFNKLPGGELDPNGPAGLPADRILRPKFLRAILEQEKYRTTLTANGVRIIGARFDEKVDLVNADLKHELWLEKSIFNKGANFYALRSTQASSLEGSRIIGEAVFDDVRIDQSLELSGGTFTDDLNLARVRIGGNLELNRADVKNKLNLDSSKVTDNVVIREGASFGAIDFSNGTIGGWMSLQGSRVSGLLRMDGITVGGNVNMNIMKIDERSYPTRFNDISLIRGQVRGQLDLSESEVNGKLNMDFIKIDSAVFMDRMTASDEVVLTNGNFGATLVFEQSTFAGPVRLDGTRTGGNVYFSKVRMKELSAVNANIAGDMTLRGSLVEGGMRLDGLRTTGNLLLSERGQFYGITLRRAQIGGQVDLSGANVVGKLDMDGLRTDSYLFMDEYSEFDDVSLSNAKIGGLFTLQNSSVGGVLDMSGLTLGGNLNLNNAWFFGEVLLRGANVLGDLDFRESAAINGFRAVGLKVTGNLMMKSGRVLGNVELEGARIGGDVDANKTTFGAVWAKDINVEQSVYFGEDAWVGEWVYFSLAKIKGNLNLTGAGYGRVVDLTDAQIGGRFALAEKSSFDKMLLSGLSFSSAEWGADPGAVANRIVAGWNKDEYSSAFYDRLAKSYSEAGQSNVARLILIQKRNGEYSRGSRWEKGYLYLWWFVTRYGYRPEYGLVCILVVVMVGAAVFKLGGSKGVSPAPPRSWVMFAIDSVIPGIHLNKDHEDIRFAGRRQYLLYGLRLLGVLLVVLVLEVIKQSMTSPK